MPLSNNSTLALANVAHKSVTSQSTVSGHIPEVRASAVRRWPALCGRAVPSPVGDEARAAVQSLTVVKGKGDPPPAAGARVSDERTEENGVPGVTKKAYALHQAKKNKQMHDRLLNCNGKRVGEVGTMIRDDGDDERVKKEKSLKRGDPEWEDQRDGAPRGRIRYHEGVGRVHERSQFGGEDELFEKETTIPTGNLANIMGYGADREIGASNEIQLRPIVESTGENQKIEGRSIAATSASEVRPSQSRQNNEAVVGDQRLGRILVASPSQSTENVDARLGDERIWRIDTTCNARKPWQRTQVIEARLGNRKFNQNGRAGAADGSESSQSSFFVEARVAYQNFNQNHVARAVDEIRAVRPSQSGLSVHAGRGDQRVRQDVEVKAVGGLRTSQLGGQTRMNNRKRNEASERVRNVGSFSGAKLGYGNQNLYDANRKERARNGPSKSKSCLIDAGVSTRTYRGRGASLRFAEKDAKPLSRTVEQITRAPEKRSLMSQSFQSRKVVNAASRDQVQKSLHLYRFLCKKLLKQAEAERFLSAGSFRVDSKSYEIMKQRNCLVNTGDPILGIVSGVEVGDEFHYRLELCIVGLHRKTCAGIDYLRGRKVLATSIVSSGVYNDKIDASDVIIYTGEGGRPKGKASDGEDQQLIKGNLGLKNCIDEQTPVRVIRGIKESQYRDSKHSVVITYIYYGLYLVEKYWSEIGRHGFMEYKFQLRRVADQAKLTVAEAKRCQKFKAGEGICVADISKGKEQISIPAVNNVDNEMPPSFTYVSKMLYPASCGQEFVDGCSCTDGCSDSGKCWCAIKNGDRIPFNSDGAIVDANPMVYECGPFCKCPSSCCNRVSQKGIQLPFEIFKTDKKGWGLRCLSSISSGAFICEYVGELIQDREAKKRIGHNEYLFEIGRSHNDGFFQDEQTSELLNRRKGKSVDKEKKSGFTIDAANFGNVGRFINHSCAPNLYAQNVLYDHDDEKLPHVMFFAIEYIPALRELTYDYNDYTILMERNIMKKECYCGSAKCSGRLY